MNLEDRTIRQLFYVKESSNLSEQENFGAATQKTVKLLVITKSICF